MTKSISCSKKLENIFGVLHYQWDIYVPWRMGHICPIGSERVKMHEKRWLACSAVFLVIIDFLTELY